MVDDRQIDFVISLAEEILGQATGRPIRLEDEELLDSRHLVIRCQVLTPAPGLPQYVILKQLAARASGAHRFLNEWANLRFLTGLGAPGTPRLLGGDREERLVLVEDLGDVPTIHDLLAGTAGHRLMPREVLVQWGELLGELQAAARGHAGAHGAIQRELGATTPESDGRLDLVRAVPALEEACVALEVAVPAGFTTTLAQIHTTLTAPDSPWRTLVHYDAGPHNVLLTDRGLRLIDFEFAGFGHGLVDVVGARMGFPGAYKGRPLPPAEVAALENAYRRRVATTVPQAADDAAFEAAAVHACAQWAVAKFVAFWHHYLRERLRQGPAYDGKVDRRLGPAGYYRRMIFTYLTHFNATASGYEAVAPVVDALTGVAAALHDRWPELSPWPVYPALGGEEE